MAKRKNDIQELLDEIVKNKMKEARSDMYVAVSYANNELGKEVSNMYDSMIQKFYSYKTKSYIRTGQSTFGTGNGLNLYRANNIKIITGKAPKLVIDINASDMEDTKYKYASKEDVLSYVMSGIRFTHPDYRIGYTWKGSYHGKYFTYDNVSINDALYIFDKNFTDYADDIIRERMRSMGWK